LLVTLQVVFVELNGKLQLPAMNAPVGTNTAITYAERAFEKRHIMRLEENGRPASIRQTALNQGRTSTRHTFHPFVPSLL
jgi:hypothetical protein